MADSGLQNTERGGEKRGKNRASETRRKSSEGLSKRLSAT